MSEPPTTGEDPADAPFQFGVRELLILQAMCAVFFALLVMVNVFAVVALFVAFLVYCMIPAKPERAARKRVVVDLCGGIVFPSLCIIYDPGLLGFDEYARTFFAYERAFIVLALLLQMSCLVVWLTLGRRLVRFSGLFLGAFLVGILAGAAIGAILLPLTLIGMLFFLLGILGLVPFFAAGILARCMWNAYERFESIAGRSPSMCQCLLGCMLAVFVPALLAWCFVQPVNQAIDKVSQQHVYRETFGFDLI